MPPRRSLIHRRRLLAAPAVWPLASLSVGPWDALAQPLGTSRALAPGAEILLGQHAPLGGASGEAVRQFNAGAQLVFDEVNSTGGVQGHRLRLISLDDRDNPALAKAAVLKLLHEHRVFACFGCVGSASVMATEPMLRDAGTLSFGAWGVADPVRERLRGVGYFVRASHHRECEVLSQQLTTLGIQRIGMAHGGDTSGADALQSATQVMTERGMALAVTAAVNPNGDNLSEAARKLMTVQPAAVLLYLPGAQAAGLMAAVRQLGGRPAFYGLSVVAGDVVRQRLGDAAVGLAIAQVMPFPWDAADAQLVRYRRIATAARVPVGYPSLEGYITARTLVEALQRCGGEFRAERLHAVLRRMQWRYAGLSMDFGAGEGTGSRFVDLVQIAPGGRYVR